MHIVNVGLHTNVIYSTNIVTKRIPHISLIGLFPLERESYRLRNDPAPHTISSHSASDFPRSPKSSPDRRVMVHKRENVHYRSKLLTLHFVHSRRSFVCWFPKIHLPSIVCSRPFLICKRQRGKHGIQGYANTTLFSRTP